MTDGGGGAMERLDKEESPAPTLNQKSITS